MKRQRIEQENRTVNQNKYILAGHRNYEDMLAECISDPVLESTPKVNATEVLKDGTEVWRTDYHQEGA